MVARALALVSALVVLAAVGCGGGGSGGDQHAAGAPATTVEPSTIVPIQPVQTAPVTSTPPTETEPLAEPEPEDDDVVEEDLTPSRAERRAAARVAAIVGWKRSSGGTGSDSTDGPYWTGWVTADGCQVKRLLLGRAVVDRSLRFAPRRPVSRRYRRSWWTVTNPAGTIGFQGYGVQGQGTENWDTDCHRSLGAALAAIPGSLG